MWRLYMWCFTHQNCWVKWKNMYKTEAVYFPRRLCLSFQVPAVLERRLNTRWVAGPENSDDSCQSWPPVICGMMRINWPDLKTFSSPLCVLHKRRHSKKHVNTKCLQKGNNYNNKTYHLKFNYVQFPGKRNRKKETSFLKWTVNFALSNKSLQK